MTKLPLSNWMSGLDDKVRLLDLTLPGTHDSGTKYVKALKASRAKTQDKEILEQLNSGIRFLDIRLKRLADDKNFDVVHGKPNWRGIAQANCHIGFNYTLEGHMSVMDACSTFLNSNPSEFIIMSINNENGDDDQAFDAAIIKAIGPISETGLWYAKEHLPQTLGDARGKIIVMRRWNGYGTPFGIDASPRIWPDEHDNPFYVDNLMCIQDKWNAPDNLKQAIDEKWPFVKAQLDLASTLPARDYLFLNFASANGTSASSTASSPQAIAEGDGTTTGILQLIRDYFSANPLQLTYGIVILDFAGSSAAGDLVQRLVDRNFKLQWPYGTKINQMDITWRGIASCYLQGNIWLFWRATSKKGELFFTKSQDGINFPQGTNPNGNFYSPESYSCCVFGGKIHLVWMGNDNPAYIYHAVTDGQDWNVNATIISVVDDDNPPQVTPTISRAPSICATEDKLYVSYSDADSAIHVIESSDGNTWYYNSILTPYSTVGPTVCSFKNRPFVFYSLFPTHQIYYSYLVSENVWNFTRGNDRNQSPSAVAACEYNGALWIFFQSNDGKNSIEYSFTTDTNFVDYDTIDSSDYTDHTLAAIVVPNSASGDQIYLAWKANDWGNWIYHSSTSLIPSGPSLGSD